MKNTGEELSQIGWFEYKTKKKGKILVLRVNIKKY